MLVSEQRLYLVCGLPGAGKTTRSRQIIDTVGAVHLSPDEWIVALDMSPVDSTFRIKLQSFMLVHAERLLRAGVSLVVEFGSWTCAERETIRQVAVRQAVKTELHFLDAPLRDLVRRVRARGGQSAESLARDVLLRESSKFERPSLAETTLFDRYVGPGDAWTPE